MNNKKLQVGDKIAVYYAGKPHNLITIDRVTDASAFSKSTRFKRELNNDCELSKIPQDAWSKYFYKLSTPEFKAKLYEVKIDKYISQQVQQNKHTELPLHVKEQFVKELKKLKE